VAIGAAPVIDIVPRLLHASAHGSLTQDHTFADETALAGPLPRVPVFRCDEFECTDPHLPCLRN
jgi:hypothetical protein